MASYFDHIRNFIYYKRKQFIRIGKGPKVFFLGIPIHNNLGDKAQEYCIRKWIANNFPNHTVIELPSRNIYDPMFSVMKSLNKHIGREDIIIFESGYNVHDLDARETLAKQIILEAFPDNRIIIMPQTVYFCDPNNEKKVSESFSKANRLLFLARDRVSYEIANRMMPSKKILLYPDIVTTLIGSYGTNEIRSGIYLCVRNDSEKLYTSEKLSELKRKLGEFEMVTEGDTSVDCDPYWLDKHIKQELDNIIMQYGKYKLIITDRYHGTIFSLIAGTPVIVIKTRDHKVSTGIEWFKGIYDYVYFADSIEIAIDLAKEIIKCETAIHPQPYFYDRYYASLKSEIESL